MVSPGHLPREMGSLQLAKIKKKNYELMRSLFRPLFVYLIAKLFSPAPNVFAKLSKLLFS